MKKKGIEYVEVWMWIIAGLLISSIIFVTGFSLLSSWIYNKEVNQASKSFSLVKSTILNVCQVGIDRQEVERYVFPRIVDNLTISNSDFSLFGEGNMLCMKLEKEPISCDKLDKEPNSCGLTVFMDMMSLEEEDGIFAIIQKATGEKNAAKIRFKFNKKFDNAVGDYIITIDWN